jgi:hypothetical protein
MNCEKVRERFSSLLEKDLNAVEEKEVRSHLETCPQCEKEWAGFQKTMNWLHSVGEEDLPRGFREEVMKKIAEQKGKPSQEAMKTNLPWGRLSKWKLPAQAIAMIAVIFVAVYVSEFVIKEKKQVTGGEEPKALYSESKHGDEKPGVPELDKEKKLSVPSSAPLASKQMEPKRIEPEKIVPERMEPERIGPNQTVASVKKEAPAARSVEDSLKPLSSAGQQARGGATARMKDAEEAKAPVQSLAAKEPGEISKEKSLVSGKPSQDIFLRTSDREKASARLRELVDRFGGEVVKAEENVFVASLPAAALREFEMDAAELGSPVELKGKASKKEVGTTANTSQKAERSFMLKQEAAAPAPPPPSPPNKEGRILIRVIFTD